MGGGGPEAVTDAHGTGLTRSHGLLDQSLALGLQLAVNVLSFPGKHEVLDNIFTRAEKSPTLRSFNELSIQDEILRMCKTESMKDLKFKKCKIHIE